MNSFKQISLHQMQKRAKIKEKVLFYKVTICDSVPLQLPTVTFNNIEIKRENSVKFLGVIVDENLI